MKENEPINLTHEQQIVSQNLFFQQLPFEQDNANNENEVIFNQSLLRSKIKEKYRQYLNQLNSQAKQKQSCLSFLKAFISILYMFFQQLWIQLIPQFIRGRYFGQKSQKIMDMFQKLNCGDFSCFLKRMKKDGNNFFIILQQKTQQQQCFQISQDLFDMSPHSIKKLSYILQCQAISLNANDIRHLEKQSNFDTSATILKLSNFISTHFSNNYKKFPILLVCRYNFLQELAVMGQIQLSTLTKEHFQQLFGEIKNYISELKDVERECKRQVLSEIIMNQE